MSNSPEQPGSSQNADDASTAGSGKRSYEAPRVLSVEPLEAAAATCDPPTGGFGKSNPFLCGTLGS